MDAARDSGLAADEHLVLKHTWGTPGMRWIFNGINQDDDQFISKAEAEATILVIAGYSMGGVTAFNTAHRVNAAHKQFAMPDREILTVKAAIPVAMVTAVDAIGRPTARPFAINQKPPNLQKAQAWYQKNRGPRAYYFDQWEENGVIITVPHELGGFDFSRILEGGPIPGSLQDNVININVNSAMGWRDQKRGFETVDLQGRIVLRFLEGGRQVQHNSIGLYVYGRNLGDRVDHDQRLSDLLLDSLL